MKAKGLFFIAVLLLTLKIFLQSQSMSDHQISMVEKSVLAWADASFEYYDGSRFENYELVPSNELFVLESKIEGLKEYREEIKQNFQSGELKKTREEVDKILARTDRKIDSLETVKKNSPAGVKQFEVDFWANILVNNGLTAYYKHHMILDPQFKILESKITGSIGKENDKTVILYKKTKK